jgi:L-alanine-DL-glutamate epimerase-like enolase superfamily enzyme
MRIVEARLYKQDQPFIDGPYTCRGKTETGFTSLIVALAAEDGTTGWGEAAPLGAFYAEAFPEAMEAGLRRLIPLTLGLSARTPARTAEQIDAAMLGQPAVKSALDMALWDLASRLAGVSLADFTGGASTRSSALYRSVSQDSPETMARKAADFVARGYQRLQVKVGADPLEDLARLEAVRAAVPAGTPLYCDANGGWRVEQALRFVRGLGAADIWLEQPCWTLPENIIVARAFGGPLVLDEGICSLNDLLAAQQAGIPAGVTLKIARLGGVGPTVLLRDVAVRLGLSVTIEDTGGSTINTAATAQLMASTPAGHQAHTVDFVNWVTVGNATGLPQTRDGRLILPEGPGIGVEADLSALGPPLLVARAA